jgi:hypothetical protein
MGCFTPKYIEAIAGIGQYQRQQEDGSDQKQGLRLGNCGRLPKGDFKGNQPGPQTDIQPEIPLQTSKIQTHALYNMQELLTQYLMLAM